MVVLNNYTVEFISKEKQVVPNGTLTDSNTQIEQSDALLIDPTIVVGDFVPRSYSPNTNSIVLNWQYPKDVDLTLFKHKIYRGKKAFSLQVKHSNGAFKALIDDPVSVKIYDAECTTGTFTDTYRLEPGQQYFYTSFLEDKITGYAFSGALTIDSKSTISVINRSSKWTTDKLFGLLPHQWQTKDANGTHKALMEMFAFRNDLVDDFVSHIKIYDAEKMVGEIVSDFASQFSGFPVQTQLGIDTLRRQIGMSQQATQWKGSRQGIIKLIRWLTTWQIGPNNITIPQLTESQDWMTTWELGGNQSPTWTDNVAPGDNLLPLFDAQPVGDLGTTNDVTIFIEIPGVAIAVGTSDTITYDNFAQNAVLTDTKVNFNLTSTIGSFLIPNQNNAEAFQVLAQTGITLNVQERITTAKDGDSYAVLTQLDLQRLQALQVVLPEMLLFNTRVYFRFIT